MSAIVASGGLRAGFAPDWPSTRGSRLSGGKGGHLPASASLRSVTDQVTNATGGADGHPIEPAFGRDALSVARQCTGEGLAVSFRSIGTRVHRLDHRSAARCWPACPRATPLTVATISANLSDETPECGCGVRTDSGRSRTALRSGVSIQGPHQLPPAAARHRQGRARERKKRRSRSTSVLRQSVPSSRAPHPGHRRRGPDHCERCGQAAYCDRGVGAQSVDVPRVRRRPLLDRILEPHICWICLTSAINGRGVRLQVFLS
jgi:hypothetical protein